MTGGYGCIGSWVTSQLVERGDNVWIFDLQEDTHRLDLVLDPEKRSKVHFVAGDVSDLEEYGRRSSVSVPRTSCIWPVCKRRRAGPIRSWGRRST